MRMPAFPVRWIAFGLAASALHANAGTQTWNPAGNGGGTGSWSGKNWGAASAWISGGTAVFGGSAGTVTVGTENVGGLNLNTGGYILSGGTLTLAPTSGAPFVFTTNVGSGTDTVTAALTVAPGTRITKTGAGTLISGVVTGGTAASPAVATITGGTFSAASGYFNSILSLNFGNTLGTAPGVAAPQFILDAGTLKFTGTNAYALGATRTVQVNPAGGAIVDGGGNEYDNAFADDAGSTASLYLSNPAGTTSRYTGVVSGAGSVTWNGPGTGSFSAVNTYTGGTVVNKGTFQLSGGALGSNTLTLASGAVLSLQGAVLRFDLSNSADRLSIQPGTVAVGGANTVRLATGNSLPLGTYPLVSAPNGGLTGTFQMDGANSLTVPAPGLTKLVGGTFYRLTLQNSATAEQVVVTAAPADVINVLPLGSSITEGVSGQGATYTGGGYRSQLYQSLVNDGRFTPNFVGSSTILDNSATAGYNVLSGANQLHHEGHGGYQTSDILANLNADSGIGGNDGGFWLAAGNGIEPDDVLLSIGGNDYGANGLETVEPVNRTDAIITAIETLRPTAHVVVANLFYRTQTTTGGAVVGDLQNADYNPAVPGVVYQHVLVGHHVSFVDQYDAVTPGNNMSLISSDGIHPLAAGYNVMATTWYDALAFGTAFWTGGQDRQWNTVSANHATNFAQNFPLTVPRQTVPDALTDVYFNDNTVALPTTLGQDFAVRGVNFAAGAAGPVSVGGTNTLTINAGGITVQAGTGIHSISANVALGSDQTWGNVSASPFTVSGVVSGAHALTVVGACTIQAPVSASGSATVNQTDSGTGPIVLLGANTYGGGTTVSSGTLVVGNTGGSGTGSGGVSVAAGGTLTNNGRISGGVILGGNAGGNGIFGGAVTVGNGAVFSAASTVNGPLTVASGGLVALSGNCTLNADGGVVNNGTIRLERGAQLVVGNGGTFTNNGTLDIMTGGFSAPAGFTNHGTVIDSGVVRITGVNVAGGVLTLSMNGYSGHSYQLQRSNSLTGTAFANLDSPQSGTTGSTLTFTDSVSSAHGFYRVQVDP